MNRALLAGILLFVAFVLGLAFTAATPAVACHWGGHGCYGGCYGGSWGGWHGGCGGYSTGYGGCHGVGCYGGGWHSSGCCGSGYMGDYGHDGAMDSSGKQRVPPPPPPPGKEPEDGKKKAEASPLGFRPVSFVR